MKKHNVFLLFTSLTALLFCACSSELKENASSKPGTVTLSIANDTQRTISPASGISYKDVSEWTVTFKDITESRSEKYNDIVKTVSFSESPNQQIQLPLGTYAVIFKGDVTKQVTTGDETSEASTEPQTVPFYGESTVTVEDGKSASVSVFVAPKKKGTGEFEFTVNIRGLEQFFDPGFEAKLIKYPQDETAFPLVSNYDSKTYSLSVTGNNISSGFYILSIKYKGTSESLLPEPKEIFYPYYDFLVEIVDGLTTNGSADITVSLADSKTYYATTGATQGNGAFKSYPKNLDKLLDDINSTTISMAEIYIDNNPELDISKFNKKGKTYYINKLNSLNEYECYYTITGAGEGSNPTIRIENQSIQKATLKNGIANIVTYHRLDFELKNGASIFIDLTSSNYMISTTIYMPDSTYNAYYAEHPCVTVKEASGTLTTSFSVYTEDSLLNSHIVVTDSSDDGNYKTTNFYIIPSATASTGVTGIPAYNLAVTRDGVDVTESTPLYADDTVVITATPADGDTFAQGTSFAWFVNGKKVEANKNNLESCSIRIGVTGDSGVYNRIICLAGYNGEYATAGTTLTAAEQTALLYTGYSSLGYAELENLNENTTEKEILTVTEGAITDFCIDTKTNDAYIIYSDASNGSGNNIGKAKYSHTSSDSRYVFTNYTVSNALGLIKMGNDDKLYVRLDGESDGKLLGIVTLSSDESGSNVATVDKISNPSEFSESSEILSFCVDNAGIMYIAYKESGSNILLGKFSIDTQYALTQENSITLATISSTDNTATSDYFNGISSALKVTDMHYIDGYIYLIVRDVFIDYSTPKDTVHSLGGVCKIKADDLTLADNANPLIGWANTTLKTTTGDTGTVYNYKHEENESSKQYYFYGPQKIIAIKPKEIVIADDGASIENSTMCNKNRVVLFNLETNSITGVKTSPTEFYFSTSGGDGTKYNPQ